MSEFLAEAAVLIRPDTSKFRAELEAQIRAIKVAPIAIPVVATGAGIGAVTGETVALTAAQKVAAQTADGGRRYPATRAFSLTSQRRILYT